jgi:hypothetical protein
VRFFTSPFHLYELILRRCRAWWNVDSGSATQVFGADTVRDCSDSSYATTVPDQFKRAVFWLTDRSTEPARSTVVFCDPKITFHRVEVSVNVQTNLVNSVTVLDTPYEGGGNVTGAPLNGRALNGFIVDGLDGLDG